MASERDGAFPERYARLRSGGHLIYLCGSINGEMLVQFQQSVTDLKTSEDGAIVVLDTHGGQTYAALSIYQELRLLAATRELTILARTRVHSAGVLLLMAVPVVHRLALAPTTFLLHPSSIKETVTVDGTIDRQEEEIRIRQIDTRDMRRRNDIINGIIATGTGHTLEEITLLDQTAEYIDEHRAVGLGLIDRVIGPF